MADFQNQKERLKTFISLINLSNAAFEKSLGLSNGYINSMRKGLGYDKLEQISNLYTNLNMGWLLTGEGEMLKSQNPPPAITELPSTNKDIKILDIRVCAGHGIGFDGEENKIIGYVNIPDFTGCYGITVYGDSMYDMYMSGDTIFVREITDWKTIDNGQPYVIITSEDRLLKTIHIDYKEKTTTLSSYNNTRYPDGKRKYPDMEIDLDNDVKHIYKVVGKLARTQM